MWFHNVPGSDVRVGFLTGLYNTTKEFHQTLEGLGFFNYVLWGINSLDYQTTFFYSCSLRTKVSLSPSAVPSAFILFPSHKTSHSVSDEPGFYPRVLSLCRALAQYLLSVNQLPSSLHIPSDKEHLITTFTCTATEVTDHMFMSALDESDDSMH